MAETKRHAFVCVCLVYTWNDETYIADRRHFPLLLQNTSQNPIWFRNKSDTTQSQTPQIALDVMVSKLQYRAGAGNKRTNVLNN